jgi:maltooligosyltrehalose trehalohydrolase
VRDLLSIRRRDIIPRLAGAGFGGASAEDEGLLSAHWRMGDGASLHLLANLSDQVIAHKPGELSGTRIWGGDPGDSIAPWSVFWRIGAR